MLLQIHEPGETPLPHENDVGVGIDLGTTNSLVAISYNEKPEVIEGILPSVVIVNGKEIHSIKRKMNNPAQLIEGKTPVEISAEILRMLKMRAENALGREVKKAVITVPAYFDDTARAATKDAARIAGLEVLRLINEPTAAALAYGLDKGAEGIYAIYDLGGGTFDISILLMQKGVFQVLATGGDTQLGGDDFDALLEGGRTAKEKLTTANAADRAEFEELAEPLIQRTLKICSSVLKDSGLDKSEISGVVLVGGSTRMPIIAARLREFFGKAPLCDINPDEAVALGAAIQAESLTQGSNNLLLDVTPLSLGLETMHGIVEKIIYRNTPIPCAHAQEFTTYENNQTGIMVHVLQGERETVEQSRSLARFELKGIPPMPAGVARVKITFTIDADGLLTVSAVEEKTGMKQEIVVKPSYGLAEAEIERMILESFEHGKADMQERLLREAKMEAERLLVSLEPAVEKFGGGDEISGKILELKDALKTSDANNITKLREDLNHMSEVLAEKIMNQEIGKALAGKTIDEV